MLGTVKKRDEQNVDCQNDAIQMQNMSCTLNTVYSFHSLLQKAQSFAYKEQEIIVGLFQLKKRCLQKSQVAKFLNKQQLFIACLITRRNEIKV